MHKSQHRSMRDTERQGNMTTLGDQTSQVTKYKHIEMGKMTGKERNCSVENSSVRTLIQRGYKKKRHTNEVRK